MPLNQKQQEAFDAVVKHKQPITYLTGEAGCGKTFTISQIIDAIPNSILTATSHQAKSVLSQLTQKEAKTVHSYFGYLLKNHNYRQVLVRKQNFEPKKTTLLVIDEVSMLPNKILKDAINLLNKYYDQILFVGDHIQLPAVSNPPNLKQLKQYEIRLTEQMRQEVCPHLSSYMQMFRDSIEKEVMPDSFHTNAPAITFIDSHKEFCRTYNLCTENKRIIAYRNAVVDKYNANIVAGEEFNIGDVVIIDKPIGSVAKNQDQVTIIGIQSMEHFYLVTVVTDSGAVATIRHYYSPSYVNAQLERFKEQHREEDYWELFESSFRLKHVYASTIHKAQGISVDYIFIDAADFISAYETPKSRYNNPISQDMFLRLMYVAISRMKTHCYIYTNNDEKGRSYETLKETPEQSSRNLSRKKPTKPKQKEPEKWTLD